MTIAVVAGPVAAVLITLWHQDRKSKREQRLTILRHLLAFRVLPADVNYNHAINLIPMEFADKPSVIVAYKEFIVAANSQGQTVTDDLAANTGLKLTRLIFEIAHSLGFKVRETDLQTDGYTSSGMVQRDLVFLDAHRAWRDIANLLFIQARQAADQPLTPEQLKFLGVETDEDASQKDD